MTDDLIDLRARVLNGEDIPAEEYARVVENLRIHREAAAAKPKKTGNSGGKTKKQITQEQADAILDQKL